jgi:hypothetical protein
MATENALQTRSYPASGDLSASQYCFMKITSSQLAVASVSGTDAVGVLQNKPDAANKAGNIAYGGTTKVLCGGTFSAGDRITCDASGKAVGFVSGDAYSLGTAMADGSSGKISSVLLDRGT